MRDDRPRHLIATTGNVCLREREEWVGGSGFYVIDLTPYQSTTAMSSVEHMISHASSFHELVAMPFQADVNAICWSRKLKGDFAEIVQKVTLNNNMAVLEEEELRSLELSEKGRVARETLLQDLQLLADHGASPTLNLIKCYERDDAFPFFPTDVYSFHVDRSPIPTDTFLCTYHGDASDIIPNAQAEQKILVPEIRAELKKLYGGKEEGFEAFLNEHFFDLHYRPKPNAKPINLGVGHLWRLAVDHPESKVPPCIHRAPEEKTGETRLLMIC